MANGAQIVSFHESGSQVMRGSFSPRDPDIRVNRAGQFVRVNRAGTPVLVVNSLLTESEWAEIDSKVLLASRYPLKIVNDLRARGLTSQLGGVGSLEARWYTQSAMTAATINMTGRGRGDRDLPEMLQDGVPVPVVMKEFAIDWRTLEASRMLGDSLDMTATVEATRVVAEAYENLIVNGNTAVTLNGKPIYGLRTHPKRKTDTATNFGGGDWGTLANVQTTVAGMVNAANAQNNYGPFVLYVSLTQYNQAALTFFTDGSGESGLDRIKKLDMIQDVQSVPSNVLADGDLLMVQPTAEYIEIAEALPLQVREYMTADGTENIFKVLLIGTPKIKARQGDETGIVHATGA